MLKSQVLEKTRLIYRSLTTVAKRKACNAFPVHTCKRSDKSLLYEEQNTYLNGVLKRKSTKKSSGQPRKSNPAVSAKGKRLGRPAAEESSYTFDYYIRTEKGIDTTAIRRPHSPEVADAEGPAVRAVAVARATSCSTVPWRSSNRTTWSGGGGGDEESPLTLAFSLPRVTAEDFEPF